ncbi:MAG: hypothetical protein WCW52_04995 [Elusimicrobiales bacterium]
MILKHRYAPLVFGTVLAAALGASLLLFRSSPGELSAPHEAAAGSSFIGNCRKCHSAAGLTAGCLSCHSEIGAELSELKGYHGRTIADRVRNCAACHSDHNGREFAMINKVSWGGAVPGALARGPETFKHSHTVFSLKGSHSELACAECHVKHAPPFSLPRFRKTNRSMTFLGLSQACVFCHKDPHAGGRASDCAKCHTQDKFKPARNFDHDKFFPLSGAHAGVSCAECHKQRDTAQASGKIFGAVAGKSCHDCHASPHRTDWRAQCRTCHTDRAAPWTKARARMTKAFHLETGFRLEKPHELTPCRGCHDPARPYAERHSAGGRPRAQKNCAACHKDPYAGQFPRRGCLDCHNETAFKPAHFTAAEHAAAYPLLGAHAKAGCADCHIRDSGLKAVRYAGTRKDCAFCHKDPHAGQFRRAGRTTCENCHRDSASWKRTVFNHNTMSGFKLSAAHSRVACKECHPPALTPDGRRVTLYKPLKHSCEDCHAAPR